MARIIFFWGFILFVVSAVAQETEPWVGKWIGFPGADPGGYGVYVFRKTFELSSKPVSFPVQVSADNRYKLFVNGKIASMGPARGDLYYWNYEEVDLAAFLKQGSNTIAALVWNEGSFRPEAQMTFQTGFILNVKPNPSSFLSTDQHWKVNQLKGYTPIPVKVNAYYVAGAGEQVNQSLNFSGWEREAFDDSEWKNAEVLGQGLPKGVFRFDYRWMLVRSILPQMELKEERLAEVRKVVGLNLPKGFPAQPVDVLIPARTKAVLLLDQRHLTNAYFTVLFSRGKGSSIKLVYAETLTDSKGIKGNRNEVEGKSIEGRTDVLLPDGRDRQDFTTLWWRTYRYVEMSVETSEEPLILHDVYGTFTGYPFQRASEFVGGGDGVNQNLEIGWRTARLCAVETYMDCPYYEQLQYIGDTRIQAMVTYYNSHDRRLAKNALNLMDQSTISEGLTLSRHPSYTPQLITTFSLWYIHLLQDFRLYNSDEGYVAEKLVNTRPTFKFFSRYHDANGSLKNLPYWVFTDWVDSPGWKDGVAPIGSDGTSAITDIQYYWTLKVAANLEAELGLKHFADLYLKHAEVLEETIRKKYWDERRQLFADRAEKDLYSQHVNSLAILSGLVTGSAAKGLAEQTLAGVDMASASIYFKYYLHWAAAAAGLGRDYFSWLGKWEENIQLGLSTWAEMSDVPRSRSDCHAWGASPNVEVFRIVMGVESVAPGFKKVRISPSLPDLRKDYSATVPHPSGAIQVNYWLSSKSPRARVSLPEGVEGTFLWEGKEIGLRSGENLFDLKK